MLKISPIVPCNWQNRQIVNEVSQTGSKLGRTDLREVTKQRLRSAAES